MFGLSEDQYNFIIETAIRPLEAKGATLWCYGSRARGDHSQFSDLDIMVDVNSDLSALIGLILERIQKSNFPYKVDLVQYSQFAEGYKDSFQKDKKPFEKRARP